MIKVKEKIVMPGVFCFDKLCQIKTEKFNEKLKWDNQNLIG